MIPINAIDLFDIQEFIYIYLDLVLFLLTPRGRNTRVQDTRGTSRLNFHAIVLIGIIMSHHAEEQTSGLEQKIGKRPNMLTNPRSAK